MANIKQIKSEETLAIIIRKTDRSNEQMDFITPNNINLQTGIFNHPSGYKIQRHIHNFIKREVLGTQEFLYIEKGRVKIIFYNSDREIIGEEILGAGDIIILLKGGHEIEVLEESTIIEVKQGPYIDKNADKVLF